MADFDSVRMPPKVSKGAIGGPRFKTSVAIMASGAESRTQEWELERGEWTVSYEARLPADWEPLLAFFRVIAAGMANTFRFKDWTDYICPVGSGFFAPTLIGGSPSLLQMVKRYTFGGFTYDRYISKPINGTITTNATGLDYATGYATSGTTWSGEFDCWCRLNNDAVRAQVITPKPGDQENAGDGSDLVLIVGWNDIEIVEVTGEEV